MLGALTPTSTTTTAARRARCTRPHSLVCVASGARVSGRSTVQSVVHYCMMCSDPTSTSNGGTWASRLGPGARPPARSTPGPPPNPGVIGGNSPSVHSSSSHARAGRAPSTGGEGGGGGEQSTARPHRHDGAALQIECLTLSLSPSSSSYMLFYCDKIRRGSAAFGGRTAPQRFGVFTEDTPEALRSVPRQNSRPRKFTPP